MFKTPRVKAPGTVTLTLASYLAIHQQGLHTSMKAHEKRAACEGGTLLRVPREMSVLIGLPRKFNRTVTNGPSARADVIIRPRQAPNPTSWIVRP